MVKTHAAPQSTPPSSIGGSNPSTPSQTGSQRNQFLAMVLTMSWQLALVFLVPVLAGVWLDKKLDTSLVCTFVGLAIAVVGSVFVMWRTMQAANRLPVPKLTAKQKREVQKRYEEEDED